MFSRDREIISLADRCGKEIERQEKMVSQKYIQNLFRLGPACKRILSLETTTSRISTHQFTNSSANCNQSLHLHERIPHERRNVNHQFVSVEKRTHPTLFHRRIALSMQLKAKTEVRIFDKLLRQRSYRFPESSSFKTSPLRHIYHSPRDVQLLFIN